MFFIGKKLHEIFLDLLEKVSFFTGRFIHSQHKIVAHLISILIDFHLIFKRKVIKSFGLDQCLQRWAKKNRFLFLMFFWCAPFAYLYFSFFCGIGCFTGIDPGMALTPFPCSLRKRRDLDPRPFDWEPSSLTTRYTESQSKSTGS